MSSNNPYFSICIPATNRHRTIFNTLLSVANQTFRDFECIITIRDPDGTSSTKEEVNRFFSSEVFKNNIFDYYFKIIDRPMDGTEDWNDPLKFANGEYIAMLEGDDTYLSYHLGQAYELLSERPNIGLYASGIDDLQGEIRSQEFNKNICSAGSIPPPSQSIFKRQNPSGKSYLYDAGTYDYCPEMELWYRIVDDGYNAYIEPERSVIRGKSINKDYSFWVDRIQDKLNVIDRCCGEIENKHKYTGEERISFNAISVLESKSTDEKTSKEIKETIVERIGRTSYIKLVVYQRLALANKGIKVLYSKGPVEFYKKLIDRYFRGDDRVVVLR